MANQDHFKNKKVLVTGGLGFLGSNLSRKLASLGAEVTALDCQLPNHGGNPFNLDGSAARWVKGDIRDAALLEKLVAGQDILFNIAAQTSHTDSMKDPFLDVDINTRGQILLLETVKKLNPRMRVVYCSSRAVYGSGGSKNTDENALPAPLDVYAVNKLAGEHYHRVYSKVHGLNTVILRVTNGYGPRAQMAAPSFGILNWFIRLALDNSEIKIFGDGKQIRDYVHVDDIVEAFLLAVSSDKVNGEVLNVAGGSGVPLIDLVEQIVRIAGRGKIVHVPWPETNKKIDVGDFIADVSKIKKLLGWGLKIPHEAGLKQTIEFYDKNRSHYW